MNPQIGQPPGGAAAMLVPSVSELNRMRKGGDDDEADYYLSPFAGIEKASVLQEASQSFNNPSTVKNEPQRCVGVLTKLLFLLAQGEKFSGNEASDVFFAVTKLFQSQDLALRRMTYLFLKEVAETTESGEIIIVTASLTKDMNSPVDMFRANAIRVLCKIVEANMLTQIERYLKQAVVDRDEQVAASALMSADQMCANDPAKRRVVSNWLPEIQSALGVAGRLQSVHYNALSVMYRIKQHDRLAVNKLVTQLSQSQGNLASSPMAVCLLVRYTARLLHDDLTSAADAQSAFRFLESCLRHRNEMVVYEAARAICRLPDVTDADIAPAVAVMVVFLKSSSGAVRFAAVRTLSEVAIKHPIAVSKANQALEGLIQDRNRSVATLAITTLLKTGSEQSVEPLTKQISSFMAELADEFKIVVVNAIRALTLKYKRKHRMLLSFLSSVLREEGGHEFKRTIVDTILEIMDTIPESLEMGLFHLCEFIEDCEFTSLSTLVLRVLGERGPKTPNPAKLIRYVYNRVILENAHVRAAAVSALGCFAVSVPALKPNILVLLRRCQQDDDDEVRDRATVLLSLLSRNQDEIAAKVLFRPLPHSVHYLELSVAAYEKTLLANPNNNNNNNNQSMTFESLPPVAEKEVTDHQRALMVAAAAASSGSGADSISAGGTGVNGAPSSSSRGTAEEVAVEDESHVHERAPASSEELLAIPAFSGFGPLFKSNESVELTERETEYLVRCVKHVFQHHVVLQFNLTNTLNDQLLSNVAVQLRPVLEIGQTTPPYWRVHKSMPVARLPYDITKPAYVSLERNPAVPAALVPPPATFTAQLTFFVKDVDPDANTKEGEEEENDDEDLGYEETYPINDLDLAFGDFVARRFPGQGSADFKATWEAVGDACELKEQFALPDAGSSIAEAAKSVMEVLGLKPCERTDYVPPTATKHNLLLAGVFLGGSPVLVHALLTLAEKSVVLKIAVRAKEPEVARAVVELISG